MKKLTAALWTLLILALCTIPGDNIPDVDLFSADKIGHFTLFAGFGCLWMWALDGSFRRALTYVVAGGLVFAVGTEIYQGVLPFDRQPSVLDGLANLLGLGAGILIFVSLESRRRARELRSS